MDTDNRVSKSLKCWKKSSFPYSERCRNTLRGHADSVNSIVFLPYSNTLLTCSADKTLSLWDARTVSKFFDALVSCPLFVLKNVSGTNRLLPLYYATVAPQTIYVYDYEERPGVGIYSTSFPGPLFLNFSFIFASNIFFALTFRRSFLYG